MQILFTRFPLETRFGGAEVQTLSLMEGLRANHHTVSFLGRCETLLRECEKRSIDTTSLSIGTPPVTPWDAVSFLWRKRRMQTILEQALKEREKPDHIFMLSLSEKILLTPLARSLGINVFWQEHDRVGRWLTRNPWLPLLRRMSRDVTTVVVSDLSKDLYVRMGWPDDRIVSIPNGVTMPDGFSRSEEGPSLRLGCIARLSRDKGVDILIDAATDLQDVTLSILGEGPEEERLREQMSESMTLMPDIETIDDFYSTIDALILPSRDHDPFGLVVAEAMLRGIPTVCTDQCGIARHLTPGIDSIVCQAGSREALRQAILLLKDRQYRKRLQEAGSKRAEELRVERMLERYETMLKM